MGQRGARGPGVASGAGAIRAASIGTPPGGARGEPPPGRGRGGQPRQRPAVGRRRAREPAGGSGGRRGGPSLGWAGCREVSRQPAARRPRLGFAVVTASSGPPASASAGQRVGRVSQWQISLGGVAGPRVADRRRPGAAASSHAVPPQAGLVTWPAASRGLPAAGGEAAKPGLSLIHRCLASARECDPPTTAGREPLRADRPHPPRRRALAPGAAAAREPGAGVRRVSDAMRPRRHGPAPAAGGRRPSPC